MTYANKQYSSQEIFKLLKSKKSDFWIEEGRKRSLNLFHAAAKRVPAYEDFLKKHGINPTKIKTWGDFQNVPSVDKKNYLRQYPLEKLCWDDSLKRPLVFTSTSGSTGEPFYFPRGEQLDWQSSIIHEIFLKNSSYDLAMPVLVIVGFGMGAWIGGLITYKAFEIASQRLSYPLSIITPGINKVEIFNALKKLAPQFKQTIIVGYPPFIKDIIDEAKSLGTNLRKLNIRFLFAAEPITEALRNYLIRKVSVHNLYLDTINIYGSADVGTMAYETTISILIKQLTLKNKKVFNAVFSGVNQTPTLTQYLPLFINFEAPGGEIVLTGDNVLPLIRYSIGDHGGVLSFEDMAGKLKDYNLDINTKTKKAGVKEIHQLPFVYVYERADFSIKLYGATIYPEHIRQVLQTESLSEFLTGKFTMLTKTNKRHDQSLEINIELKLNIKAPEFLMYKVRTMITKALVEKNSEYRNNYNMIPKKVTPEIIFWPHEHPLYFKSGVKQQWVKK